MIVQFPAGRPLKETEPSANIQVGSTTKPKTGAVGFVGIAEIDTDAETTEVQPWSFVTV